MRYLVLFLFCTLFFQPPAPAQTASSYDICIYGGTSAGIIAAYTARKLGKSVLLIEPTSHLGGLTTGGLGAPGVGNKHAVTGLARRFYRDLGAYYGTFESWTYEPKAAAAVFRGYIRQTDIEILPVAPLVEVVKAGNSIEQILVHPSGRERPVGIRAQVFLDCSYEGDLMAMAGVSYTVGRESNERYGEIHNGVQLGTAQQFPAKIDPYRRAGSPESGLLWGISDATLAPQGSGDARVQAYAFRVTLTDSTKNRIPVSRPKNYQVDRYELLLRLIRQSGNHNLYDYFAWNMLPNRKTDIASRGPFSTDMVGYSEEYPEANWEKRSQIITQHEEYTKGLLYFLGHDPRVPESMRQEMKKWGYPRDEFIHTSHFTPQLYIREARRMIGEYVITEHTCTGDTAVTDGIALAPYPLLAHPVQRLVVADTIINEGAVSVGGFAPCPIPYQALVPRQSECNNLLVPVAVSASHSAYGAIRREPVLMMLGQVAATAASQAIDQKRPVQEIRLRPLQQQLRNDPFLDGTPPDVVVDLTQPGRMSVIGPWDTLTHWTGQRTEQYLIARNGSTQPRRVSYTASVPQDGNYKLFLSSPQGPEQPAETYARQVPIQISVPQGTKTRTVDMEQKRNDWIPLGNYLLKKGQQVRVSILADGISEPVAADAILLVNAGNTR